MRFLNYAMKLVVDEMDMISEVKGFRLEENK